MIRESEMTSIATLKKQQALSLQLDRVDLELSIYLQQLAFYSAYLNSYLHYALRTLAWLSHKDNEF